MNQLTTIASMPGSGAGALSALPAEVKKTEEVRAPQWMAFNVNDYVYVRLTDAGREAHNKSWIYIMGDRPYRAPYEDADGWSKWQMWNLMQEFGHMFHLSATLPFETDIRVESK